MKYLINFCTVIIFLMMFIVEVNAQTKSEKVMMIKIYVDTKDDIVDLNDMNLDYATSRIDGYAQAVVTQTELDEIIRRGFETEIVTYPDRLNLVDPEYHTYEEVLNLIDSIAVTFPNITHVEIIGESQMFGYSIPAIKISDNPDIEEDEPAILYDGLHHAREPVGMECCLVIMDYLLNNYGVDPQVTDCVDNTEIWFIPMMNPEGWKYIVDDNLSNPWWRKNQRDNDLNGYFNASYDGVDINRNYDYNWAIGGSGDPSSWVYRGPSPFSEKEVQAKRDLALEQKFIASISYHSYGEVVLYSWSESPSCPDQLLMIEISDAIALNIPAFYSGSYASMASDCQNGYSRCWMYVVAGTFEFTLETAYSFIPPGVNGLQIAQDNLPGALYLLDRILGPGLTGHITDAVTSEPLSATVKILEIYDPVLTPRTSDEMYGRYFRMLQPGTYNVEVFKDGYQTVTVNNVQVNSGNYTQLDIQMDSTLVSIDNEDRETNISNGYVLNQNYPNPFNPNTVISYHLSNSTNVILKIYNMLGAEVTTLVDEYKLAGNHSVVWSGKDNNGRNVSSGVYMYRMEVENNAVISGQSKKLILMK